jgi:predicted DNA-binding transcriptional regulator AlpA
MQGQTDRPLYNRQEVGEDVGVPETPNPKGSPRLLTVPEITERHGVSRQAIHNYRQRGVFPQPAPEQGSTRLRFREDEVDAFFVANPKRPGRRTDRETANEGAHVDAEQPLRAVVTVTVETRPDGDYYVDEADLTRHVKRWIEEGLEDRDDIAKVSVEPGALDG